MVIFTRKRDPPPTAINENRSFLLHLSSRSLHSLQFTHGAMCVFPPTPTQLDLGRCCLPPRRPPPSLPFGTSGWRECGISLAASTTHVCVYCLQLGGILRVHAPCVCVCTSMSCKMCVCVCCAGCCDASRVTCCAVCYHRCVSVCACMCFFFGFCFRVGSLVCECWFCGVSVQALVCMYVHVCVCVCVPLSILLLVCL